jgi:alkylhydroperoxidase family enzyme
MEGGRSNAAQARRDCDGCAAPDDEARLSSVARALIVEHPDPATLLEIYYWSQEPGLGQTIRAYMSLPKRTRSVLRAFWQMAGNPHHISATIDERGRLELSSPQIVDTLTLLRGDGRPTSRV